MDLGLNDKVAIVAGGSRGCGRGIVEELAREGAAVVLSGRNREAVDAMMSATAMGRWGRPDEMGAMVAFLCSERASYVSGETIRVDGGYSHSLF